MTVDHSASDAMLLTNSAPRFSNTAETRVEAQGHWQAAGNRLSHLDRCGAIPELEGAGHSMRLKNARTQSTDLLNSSTLESSLALQLSFTTDSCLIDVPRRSTPWSIKGEKKNYRCHRFPFVPLSSPLTFVAAIPVRGRRRT